MTSFTIEIPESKTIFIKSYLLCPPIIGVYSLFNDMNEVLYIGKSSNIKNRIGQHCTGHNTNVKNINEISYITYWECKDEYQSHLLEIYLINKHSPTYNIEFVSNRRNTKQGSQPVEKEWVKSNDMYKDFARFSNFTCKKEFNEHINRFKKHRGSLLTKNQLKLLDILTKHSIKITGVCSLKHETIQKLMGENGDTISTATIRRAISKFNEFGLISIHSFIRKRGGRGANIYVFNKDYAKQSYWKE